MLKNSNTSEEIKEITSQSPTSAILVTWFLVTLYTLWVVCRKALQGELGAIAALLFLILMVML